jgi:hypothetical protein
MTANHVEHEIATFPGSPGRGGQQRRRGSERAGSPTPLSSSGRPRARRWRFQYREPTRERMSAGHLPQSSRHIAECEAYIAKQRELIERAIQQGRSTEVAEETLESLEASLRTLERAEEDWGKRA